MSIVIRTLLVAAVYLLAVGAVASAEPAQQAAPTATPVPAPAATAVPCVTARQGIQVILQNPQPGDTLLSGTSVVMSGIAYDPASTSGPGIASVKIFLDDRAAGGLALGTAVLGQPNPLASAGSQFATAGFTLRTSTLPAGNGGRSLFVYAQSALGSAEGVLEVPIFMNAAPTPVRGQVPTAVLPPPPACTPTPVPVPTATSTPTAPPALIVAPPPTIAPSPTPFPTLALRDPGAPAAPAPAAPPAAAPKPQAAAPVPLPATVQPTAPGGGGVPSELGLAVIALGTLVLGGGWAMRRRDRRSEHKETDTTSSS